MDSGASGNSSGTSCNVGVETESDIDITSLNQFPDNAFYHKLSPGERITLVQKYLQVPEPVQVDNSRKKKDKNELVMDEKDKLCQSFPVHSSVTTAFNDYVDVFEKTSYKSLTADPKSGDKASSDTNSTESKARRETPASNKYDIKSGFQIAPTIEKWEFRTHNRAIPQVVSFDGDLAHIKSDSKSPNPSNIKLTDGEWGNLQKSASYALRAVSHGAWFRDAAFTALDEALPFLDPAVPANEKCIQTLIDVKQFLIGIDYAFDKLAKYCVYPHAGVTSVLRKEFLSAENRSMLLEEQSKLFALPYGDSLVFQGGVQSVAPQVQKFRESSRASALLESTMKIAETGSKSKGGSGGGNSSNFPNTRSRSSYQSDNKSQGSYHQQKRSNFSRSPNRSKSFQHQKGGHRGGAPPQSPSNKGTGGRGKSKGKKGK